MIDLPEADLATVKHLVSKYLPDCKAYAFGSRVRGTARKYSDLDIESDKPVDLARQESLRDAFSESNLPILVDLVDLRTVSETFRKRIEETREPL